MTKISAKLISLTLQRQFSLTLKYHILLPCSMRLIKSDRITISIISIYLVVFLKQKGSNIANSIKIYYSKFLYRPRCLYGNR
ncbi:hypothetical protein GDO78_001297 [Eleutherodactylus coqui]|uniref:Uncharacterized protein n=1 Tax=Eleutherodactylus coqui TaxID=57060 RepID=A0A8J6FUZ1_ELECQ|nr:hypothetical protein GDO78_001297 [Eleutherodactylus coqui]